jgi:hypothetical protein
MSEVPLYCFTHVLLNLESTGRLDSAVCLPKGGFPSMFLVRRIPDSSHFIFKNDLFAPCLGGMGT